MPTRHIAFRLSPERIAKLADLIEDWSRRSGMSRNVTRTDVINTLIDRAHAEIRQEKKGGKR